MEAAKRLGIRCPIKTSRGAKRLTRNASLAGALFVARNLKQLNGAGGPGGILEVFQRPFAPAAGAFFAFDRMVPGKPESAWQGHFGFVDSYDLMTDTLVLIEGNGRATRPLKGQKVPKGAVMSKWAIVDRHTYVNGTWRPRCALITSFV
jgi:hypothetical protein